MWLLVQVTSTTSRNCENECVWVLFSCVDTLLLGMQPGRMPNCCKKTVRQKNSTTAWRGEARSPGPSFSHIAHSQRVRPSLTINVRGTLLEILVNSPPFKVGKLSCHAWFRFRIQGCWCACEAARAPPEPHTHKTHRLQGSLHHDA